MQRTPWAVSALAAAALATSGCGEGAKTKTTATSAKTTATATVASTPATPPPSAPVQIAPGTPLSRAQWMAHAEAICRTLYTEIEANRVRTPADYARVLPQIAASEQASLGELAKIVPPSTQTTAWEKFLQGIQQQAQGMAKLGGEAQAGGAITKDPYLLTINRVIEHRRAGARHAGFRYCALV